MRRVRYLEGVTIRGGVLYSHRVSDGYRILLHRVRDLLHNAVAVLAVLRKLKPGITPRHRRVVGVQRNRFANLRLRAAADLHVQLHRHTIRLESGRRRPLLYDLDVDRLRFVGIGDRLTVFCRTALRFVAIDFTLDNRVRYFLTLDVLWKVLVLD